MDKQKFLDWIAENGGKVTNKAAKEFLGFDSDQLEKAKALLINEGLIIKWRCRGGGIAIVAFPGDDVVREFE